MGNTIGDIKINRRSEQYNNKFWFKKGEDYRTKDRWQARNFPFTQPTGFDTSHLMCSPRSFQDWFHSTEPVINLEHCHVCPKSICKWVTFKKIKWWWGYKVYPLTKIKDVHKKIGEQDSWAENRLKTYEDIENSEFKGINYSGSYQISLRVKNPG